GVTGGASPVRHGGLLSQAAGALADTLQAERSRWFLWLPVFLGSGIALYYSLAAEPDALTVWAMAAMALSLRLVWRRSLAGTLITAGLVAMAAGFALAKIRTEWTRAPILERTHLRASIHGIVELVEPRPKRGERITLLVTSIEGVDTAKLPRRARIRTMVATPGMKPGSSIRLTAKIAPPAAPSLPGDYDFARAAWYMGIGATGYALTKAEILSPAADAPLTASRSWPARWNGFLEDLRQRIGLRVTAALPGETGAIASALITGARGAITEETNAAFRDSGLFHILSISGLHMVVMAGAAFLSVRRLLALVPFIALNYPVKKWAAGVALIAAFAYLNISGSSVATVRSAVMIAIIFLAILIDRPALAMRNVALSALLILAVMPESLLDAGFQMSYAAVISLIAVYEVLRARTDRQERQQISAITKTGLFFGGIVLSTLIASFSVAPLAAFHFHKTQQFAVIANLIAIPVCNIVVMPAGLLTLVAMPAGLEATPLAVMGVGIEVMVWAARTVAAMPGAVGHIPAIPQVSLIFMTAGGLWLTLWQTRWRLAGIGIVAAGLAAMPFHAFGDILAGRAGTLVTVRARDGALHATPGRHGGFELKRWLENDGDARTVAEASGPGTWTCDGSGCVAAVKGVTVAAVRHASALPEDCGRVRVLILPFPKPEGCTGPEVILDPRAFWSEGTHVITIEGMGHKPGMPNAPDLEGADPATSALQAVRLRSPQLLIETVASRRGQRPWTVALAARDERSKRSAGQERHTKSGTRLPSTSSSVEDEQD
ncbi:MAG: ComEC/Rec2 family competence protein, partial [Hyphomicrobium sp.]